MGDFGGDFGGILFLCERLRGIAAEVVTACLIEVPLCWPVLAGDLVEVLAGDLPENCARLPLT